MHLEASPLIRKHFIRNVRHRSDNIHIKLTVKTFLYNLHMQHTQKTTTETKTQRSRRFRLKCQRRIIQLQLLKRCTQILKIFSLNRVHTSKHHWLHLFKTINSIITRTLNMSNRITHLYLFRSLNARNNITHITSRQLLLRHHIKFQNTNLIRLILLACIYKFNQIIRTNCAINNLKISNNTTERVKHRVKNQALKRSIRVTFRCWNSLNNRL